MLWRRSFDIPPPPIDDDDEFSQARDVRYADLGAELPRTECLKDVIARLLPYWDGPIADDLRAGQTVLVAAHGNSLRGIVKHLDGISDDDIAGAQHPDRDAAGLRARRRPAAHGHRWAVPRPRRRRRGRRGRGQPGSLSVRPTARAHEHVELAPADSRGRTAVKPASSSAPQASVATGNCPVTTKTTRLATETAWSAIRS